MIPRARHTDIAAPAKNDVMALSIMTGEATHRTRPANDVKAEDRQNLLVRPRLIVPVWPVHTRRRGASQSGHAPKLSAGRRRGARRRFARREAH